MGAIDTLRDHERLLWDVVKAQAPDRERIESAIAWDEALADVVALLQAAEDELAFSALFTADRDCGCPVCRLAAAVRRVKGDA